MVNDNNIKSGKIESILLKKFSETLSKGSMMWYSLLQKNSIDYFEMLIDDFVKSLTGAKKVQVKKANILKIAQGDSKLL